MHLLNNSLIILELKQFSDIIESILFSKSLSSTKCVSVLYIVSCELLSKDNTYYYHWNIWISCGVLLTMIV